MLTQNLVKRKQVSGITKALGYDSTAYWEINKNISLKDFAINLEARPSSAEWNDFYLALKDCLAKNQIDADDYIDIMRVKNLKMASELMKSRKKKKKKMEEQVNANNIKLQSEENAKASIAIEEAKQNTLKLEYKLMTEHELAVKAKDSELLREKFKYDSILKGIEVQSKDSNKQMESDTKIITKWMDINNQNNNSNKIKQP